MDGKIYVVGIGPGTAEYLLPVARKTVEACDVLIGGQRALDLFKDLPKETLIIRAKLTPLVDYIKKNRHRNIAVLVSGDPGFYSMLTFLSKHFSPEELEIIPGISSIQLAFARLKGTWQDAGLASLHGRELAILDHLMAKGLPKLGLLTDPDHSPQKIAAYLLENGYSVKRVVICQNLAYPDEEILVTSLEELQNNPQKYLNCVMVIENE